MYSFQRTFDLYQFVFIGLGYTGILFNEELIMNLLTMIINDPVVLYSFAGLAVVLGICSYYVWFFLKNIHENN